MLYAIISMVSAVVGAVLVFLLLEGKRKKATEERALADGNRAQAKALVEQASIERDEARAMLEQARKESEAERRQAEAILERARAEKTSMKSEWEILERDRSEVEQRKVTFDELRNENRFLKTQLATASIQIRKSRLDRDSLGERQEATKKLVNELAERYLSDVEKWVAAAITARNYTTCKQRLETVIAWCREVGFEVSEKREAELIGTLKRDFEEEVRKANDREEQARIKARIREEQAREREVQRMLDTLEREQAAIQDALAKAMARAGPNQTDEIERLKAKLAEAEARNQRALSQAQLTRAGHIYVISNLGTFGDGVYKIGMTRRLEPIDRINELGDASVPFPFDVHMMISCDDAPSLETELHRYFHKQRINKVNPKKEFFRVGLEAIKEFVIAKRGEVHYMAEHPASEFRQSVTMSESDQEYIEKVFQKVAPEPDEDG